MGPAREDSVSVEYVDVLRKFEAARESDVVEQVLSAAREHLSMDAAYITTMDSEHQVIDAFVGQNDALARFQGVKIPLERTYCKRMLDGEIPNVIPDTSAEPAVRGLAATQAIGTYVGIPVKLSDGRVHGTLCCVSKEPRSGTEAADLRFLEVLASIVATRIERAQGDVARLTARLKARQGAA